MAHGVVSLPGSTRSSDTDRRRGPPPWRRSDLDLALILAVPIMQVVGMDLDQGEAGRVDALLEPAFEILVPMLGEHRLVPDQLGRARRGDEQGRLAEQAAITVQGQADARIGADLLHALRLVEGEA